jgi:UDP-glucose 4-epimerase
LARILVTGAAGFIGRALCRGLVERGHEVVGATREGRVPITGAENRAIGNIGPHTNWSRHLDRVEVVVHLANQAHRPTPGAHRADEARAAAELARAAARAGVGRLIYMSSVRAMGETTEPGAPFRCTDLPLPRDTYGLAKLAIERALVKAATEFGLDLVVLRPPLVYGPGVRANFLALLRLTASGLPLPFAAVQNRRSLIFIENLVDVTARSCIHADAAGRVLLACDPVDLSTPELIRALAAGLGRSAHLFAIPQAAFALLRRLPVIGPLAARLTLSLQVDDRETRAALDWRPPVSPGTGLAATARAFALAHDENVGRRDGVL